MENIIQDFCQAWQTLDSELITKHLSEDFVYDSQWVFESLNCERYKEYIEGKFATLRKNNITLSGDVVDDSSMGGKMLRILQGDTPCYYRIKVKDGKVTKGDLCMF